MAAFKRTGPEGDRDREAFGRLYREYRQIMFKTAYRILKDGDRAEDAVHEVFLTVAGVMEKLEEFDDTRTERYLLRSVKNKAIDFLRAKKRDEESRLRLKELEAEAAAFSGELSARMEDKEQLSALKRGLLGLSPEERELLTLFFTEGITPEEIAKMYHISRKTVYNRVHAIIQKLQAELRKEGFLG